MDPYVNILKYIQSKVISIYNNSKGNKKIPILALGNDMIILSYLASNNKDIYKNKLISGPNKIKFEKNGDSSWIFSELQKSDFEALENENICSNYLTNIMPKKIFESKLTNYYKIISTSQSDKDEYVSIMESNLYPIIGMSFHPEHIVFEENTIFNVPDSFEAIKTARFIGNSFVNYGRLYSHNDMTIEEKKDNKGKFDFIDPYGEFPVHVYRGGRPFDGHHAGGRRAAVRHRDRREIWQRPAGQRGDLRQAEHVRTPLGPAPQGIFFGGRQSCSAPAGACAGHQAKSALRRLRPQLPAHGSQVRKRKEQAEGNPLTKGM